MPHDPSEPFLRAPYRSEAFAEDLLDGDSEARTLPLTAQSLGLAVMLTLSALVVAACASPF